MRGDGSRSRSRPASLVINTAGNAEENGAESYGALGVLNDASPIAVTSVPPGAVGLVYATSGPAGDRGVDARADAGNSAISPWSEPETFMPGRSEAISPWSEPDEPGFDRGESSMPERLGVLPSPTATAFSTIAEGSPTKSGRSRQGSAVSAALGGKSRQGSRVDEAIREDEDDQVMEVPRAPEPEAVEGERVVEEDAKPTNTYEELQRGWGTDSEAESEAKESDARPEYDRMESARAFLPSQLKGTSLPQSPRTPRSPRSPDEELYEVTPRQTHFPRQISGENGNEEGEETGVVSRSIERDALDPDNCGVEQTPSRVREDTAFGLVRQSTAGAPEDVLPADAPLKQEEVTATTDTSSKEPELSARSSAQDWDKRSAVSSEDHFHDAKEGDSTEPSHGAQSRRSSVSSMGNAAVEEQMSAQAVPAGPIGPTQQRQPETMETDQQERFMNRPYSFEGQKPMSYMPLGTTASGAPIQESLDDDSRPESPSVDLSGISGPPVGTQPYQKHPAMRDAEAGGLPGDHGGLRSPPPAPDLEPVFAAAPMPQPTPRSRQVSAEAKDRTSKRFSGFFRSGRPSQSATTVYGPAPSAISDQYGLENLPTGPAAVARPGTQASGNTLQAKRQSGIWNSFKRSSVMLPDDSRQSSIALPSRMDITAEPSPPPRDAATPRANTLKKPQRATTNATPPDPAKKKRFSGLGSLFGRSSTTGHKTERPRKLMKQPNPSREASHTQIPGTSSVTSTLR